MTKMMNRYARSSGNKDRAKHYVVTISTHIFATPEIKKKVEDYWGIIEKSKNAPVDVYINEIIKIAMMLQRKEIK